MDGPGVRGEGGALDPRLVVPTTITMAPQSREKQLAVTELMCSLHLGPGAHANDQVGRAASRTFLPELHARSVEQNPNPHNFELRFSFTPALVEQLDSIRQASANADLRLQVKPKVPVCLIYQVSGGAPI